MLLTDIVANGFLFDIELKDNHPTVENALLMFDEETLRTTIANAFSSLGLTHDNLDEMNKGATWAIAHKAASLA